MTTKEDMTRLKKMYKEISLREVLYMKEIEELKKENNVLKEQIYKLSEVKQA